VKELRKLLSICALAIGCSIVFVSESVLTGGAIATMSLLIWPWGFAQNRHTENIRNLENKENMESLNKARTDYAMIQGNIGMLQDKAMAAQVQHMQAIAGKLLKYLDSHPQRISSARRFIDYYQDRTAALIQQYVSLRKTGLENQEIDNLQCNMRTTFQGFTAAYEKQFTKVIDGELLDMNAEMKVAKQLMREDGIDCDKVEPSIALPQENETDEESKKETGWTLKQAGIAVGAVALGAVGLWKIFGGDKKKND